MFGLLRNRGRDRPGVLAERVATHEARHPRAPEPTAAAALAARPGEPACVDGNATMRDALRVMVERDATAVAVMAPAGLLGVFSTRDVVRAAALGGVVADDTPVADAMSRAAAEVAPSDSVRRCLDLVAERGVTHAAVLDRGLLLGLLSEADLLAAEVGWRERMLHEIEVDRKLMFLRGTYSC